MSRPAMLSTLAVVSLLASSFEARAQSVFQNPQNSSNGSSAPPPQQGLGDLLKQWESAPTPSNVQYPGRPQDSMAGIEAQARRLPPPAAVRTPAETEAIYLQRIGSINAFTNDYRYKIYLERERFNNVARSVRFYNDTPRAFGPEGEYDEWAKTANRYLASKERYITDWDNWAKLDARWVKDNDAYKRALEEYNGWRRLGGADGDGGVVDASAREANNKRNYLNDQATAVNSLRDRMIQSQERKNRDAEATTSMWNKFQKSYNEDNQRRAQARIEQAREQARQQAEDAQIRAENERLRRRYNFDVTPHGTVPH